MIKTIVWRCITCGYEEKHRFLPWEHPPEVMVCPKCGGVLKRAPGAPANHFHPTKRRKSD